MTATVKALAFGVGVNQLLGLGSSPKVDTSAATSETQNAQDQATLARAQLFETEGGANGAQLSPGQVGPSRATLFGN